MSTPHELMLTEAERHTWAMAYSLCLGSRYHAGAAELADRAIQEARARSLDNHATVINLLRQDLADARATVMRQADEITALQEALRAAQESEAT